MRYLSVVFLGLILCSFSAIAQTAKPYEQTIDHVYLSLDGVDFHMDIFVPTGQNQKAVWKPGTGGEGLGILDVASGAWSSDRGKIRDHESAQMYNIFCSRGYTVFAVRPGTRGKYTIPEMVSHLQHAIRYIKANAETYSIDPERLGITGASAGGHLTCLTTLSGAPGNPDATDPLLQQSTELAAAIAFFPPTDFLNWGDKPFTEIAESLGDIWFLGGVEGHADALVMDAARAASPLYQVKAGAPPFILVHGDADPVVPLQQSEKFVAAMKDAGNDVEFIVKPGGGHPWIDIPFEVIKVADWMDGKLAK